MESLIKKAILFLFISLSLNAYGQGILYFSNFLGHVHKEADKNSTSQTIVQCSHSVKLLKAKKEIEGWSYVQVGEDVGYIQSEFLSEKKVECLQAKYPYFYNGLELDITQMYFWGRLYDHYIQGTSKIK